ncbi:ErpC protein [Borreliella kurtenbachii]|uniref:ErpC protein n=1 Tax=Borreliella kurtenbachii TaxID=1196056 RepID=UPI0034620399
MNKKTFIICAVFVLIISCKNFATGKDIKQNAGEKVQGFVDKILDPTKNKITSSGSKADEVAKKLQEEELMQGDDPNNGVINPSPVLSASGQDNAPVLKAEQQSGGQQEERKVEKTEAEKEDSGKKEKVEKKEEKQEGKEENTKEKKKEEQNNEKQEKLEKEKLEKEAKEKAAEQKRQQEKEEQQRKAEQEEKQRQEQEKLQQELEKKKVENKIKDLTDKINKINKDIDSIKDKTIVGAEEVIDKITGPVYDDFTNGNNSIRTTWGDLEDEVDEGLGKLLEELSDARNTLRNKLNEGNKSYILDTRSSEPKLKESVDVSEIKEDLEKLKSELEKVKSYFEDSSKFEEIKGYISDSQ